MNNETIHRTTHLYVDDVAIHWVKRGGVVCKDLFRFPNYDVALLKEVSEG